jgi:hypothetical protein
MFHLDLLLWFSQHVMTVYSLFVCQVKDIPRMLLRMRQVRPQIRTDISHLMLKYAICGISERTILHAKFTAAKIHSVQSSSTANDWLSLGNQTFSLSSNLSQ